MKILQIHYWIHSLLINPTEKKINKQTKISVDLPLFNMCTKIWINDNINFQFLFILFSSDASHYINCTNTNERHKNVLSLWIQFEFETERRKKNEHNLIHVIYA